jgi:enoyl-CoA hydratase
MDLTTLLYEKDGRVATITLNRPEAVNAISLTMRDELDLIMNDLEVDGEIWVVSVNANGAKFCSGYDMLKRAEGSATAVDYSREKASAGWLRRYFHLSRERRIGEVHIFGMWPVHLGMRRSKEWRFTVDSMTGTEAAEIGLVNRSVPAPEVDGVVHAFAQRVPNSPLDLIFSHKDAVHRWFDAMGIMAGMASANDLDPIDLTGPTMAEFGRRIAQDRFKQALEWRDGPFREHWTCWEAYQASSQGASEPERAC